MTGSWVQICTAAARISKAGGKPVSVVDVHRLGYDDGPLTVSWLHDHFGVLESSLAAYLNDLAAHGGDDQTAGPTVRGGPEIGDEAEALYREEKRT